MSSDPDPESFTIEKLAQRTGLTVRTIRSWNSKGLLPAPEIRGRTGYYDESHVRRVATVQSLLAEGYNLGVIARMLERSDDDEALLGFARAVVSSHGDGDLQLIMSGAELRAPWGESAGADYPERLVELGLAQPLGDDRYEIFSPRLVRVAEQLASVGLPVDAILAATRDLAEGSDRIASAFFALFMDHVWGGWEVEPDRPRDWEQLGATMLRLRSLSGEAAAAMVALRLDQITAQNLERMGVEG